MPQRFLRLADVADEMTISISQAYNLVRSGELRAIKVGGRGEWRVERCELEDFIKRMYEVSNPAAEDLDQSSESSPVQRT